MGKIESLKDIIEFNSNFKTAINLYLNLNRADKILGYIPTKSSVSFFGEYANAVLNNKEQATLLIGPYGKGKSHLLLVLLAVMSMDRSDENKAVIDQLLEKIKDVDEIGERVSGLLENIWNRNKFLPVLISDTTGDLNQAFLYALNHALGSAGLNDLIPDTYYSIALDRLDDWEKNYSDTYILFEKELIKKGSTVSELKMNLKMYSKDALQLFKSIYPMVTAGSEFNPLAVSEVLPLYKSTSEKLVEEYQYSGIYIVFDEFSKFIESQDGMAVGTNMKLLQDICELANDSKDAQVFFTMVTHKSIKEYGKFLSQDIINSFTGIEGRIIEKYFVTSSKNNYELIKHAILKKEQTLKNIPHYGIVVGPTALREYYNLPVFRSNFEEPEFDNIILKGCYPLNPIASYLLLNVSEKVAQNERTLFTFISNDEPYSMARFVAEHSKNMAWSIGADLIYDYFSTLFKKEVANEYVHNIWLSAEYTVNKCKSDDQKKIAKALAIILIVNKEDEMPATDKYLRLSVCADDYTQAIEILEKNGYLYKKSSTGSYVFKTRAGSELKAEIKRQRELKGDNVNYAKVLSVVTGKYYIAPRKYNTKYMMTRYFMYQYMDFSDFLNINSAAVLLNDCVGDGKVICLFSFSKIDQNDVEKHLHELGDSRIVVVCPTKILSVKKQLRDYEIIQELRKDQAFTSSNEILNNEIPLLIEDLTLTLEKEIQSIYEDDIDTKVFFCTEGKIKQELADHEEQVINKCCEKIYTKTPIINNEMVNREVIGTPQTKKARLNIIQAILNHTDDEVFYGGTNQEASIYRALFCVTNIINDEPSDNFKEILLEINNFVDSCSENRGAVKKLMKCLTSAPYGMRMGVIPFYLAFVLSKRREDIVIYFANKEIHPTADIIVNMCEQAEDYSIYISREELQKETYISQLNDLYAVYDNRNLSENRIENIFICMQRWFRALPQVTRNLTDVNDYVESSKVVRAMKEIKKAMQKIEFNSFETLFVLFPKAFKTNSFEQTYVMIRTCKEYYDNYFRWIEKKVVDTIYDVFSQKRKKDLYHYLKEWYDSQSTQSKQGLYDGRMTNFMSTVETINVFSDEEIAEKIVKAVTDIYIENWGNGSLENFSQALKDIKIKVESTKDNNATGEMKLSFTKKDGELFEKMYSYASESTGSVLRNIIEDTLEEYDDLSVNDRVAILLEMIEKITK